MICFNSFNIRIKIWGRSFSLHIFHADVVFLSLNIAIGFGREEELFLPVFAISGVILNPNSGKRHYRPWSANTIKIPNYEENMSTKSWLNKYGICKLKLDFNRIVSNCEHFGRVEVPTIGKSVHARYI